MSGQTDSLRDAPFPVITLPNGKQCTLPKYVQAWKTLATVPEKELITGFFSFPHTAGAVRRELRRGLHDRINRHLAGYGQGRKWDPQYQTEAMRIALEVNTPRRAVHAKSCRHWPRELRARLAHRISED
jgi:hypothetical protein